MFAAVDFGRAVVLVFALICIFSFHLVAKPSRTVRLFPTMTALASKSDRKPVGIWIRVSTEDQARGDSPEHHEKRAQHYAEAKGWRVREVYHLEAVSGKAVYTHPETKRMLEHIRSGHIIGMSPAELTEVCHLVKMATDEIRNSAVSYARGLGFTIREKKTEPGNGADGC